MSRQIISFSKIALIVAMIGIAGCTRLPPKVDNQLVAEPDTVALRLATAVDRASTALEKLAATEQKRDPAVKIDPVPKAPTQLMRSVTMDWTGPIEAVVMKLADRASYKFETHGDAPPVPVIVNIAAMEKPVVEVLRDVGLQAGQRATVVVDAERQVIEVQYATQHSG